SRRQLEHCDLLVMVYDSSDPASFAYLANLRSNYSLDALPMIFVATKSDLDAVAQRSDPPPDIYCRELKLAAPLYVSPKDAQLASVFQHMAAITRNPASATPALLLARPHPWSTAKIIGVTALAGVGLASTFVAYHTLRYWWTSVIGARSSHSVVPKRHEL
ncbi:ERMES complex Ca(2+)-binding regulatory GTPase gem1, partial [Coemansia nantahalensis]